MMVGVAGFVLLILLLLAQSIHAANQEKLVMFVIEHTDGSRRFCGSGGMNHAKHLLTSFLGIASVLRDRKPVVYRPTHIFAKSHGEIPESVVWSDLFNWNVDNEEFKSPDDIWNALDKDPGRFEVFDVYHKTKSLVKRLQESKADIVLLHMYGQRDKNNRTMVSCVSYTPFQQAEIAYNNNHGLPMMYPTFAPPSNLIIDCANFIIKQLNDQSNGLGFVSVHVRRGDALRHGVNGGGGYHGYNLVQLMLVTSPEFVESSLRSEGWEHEKILLFTNEENTTMFDMLNSSFHMSTEDDLITLLPDDLKSRVSNAYSRYLLLIEIAKAGKAHMCTVARKLGTACTSTLISKIPDNCTKTNCPVICRQDGSCETAPVSKKTRYEMLLAMNNKKKDVQIKRQTKQLRTYFKTHNTS